jgi:hypothetical protein
MFMKNVVKILAVTLALALSACGGSKNNGARTVTRASTGNPAPPYVTAAGPNGLSSSGAQWVQITGITDASAKAYVNGAVTLGTVVGCANCGGFFNISQNPNSNNFTPLVAAVSMSQTNYNITGSPGVLTVMIIDSDYSTMGPIWAVTNLASGQMTYSNSGTFTLGFGDGSTVIGGIQGQSVQSGNVEFNGATPTDTLGKFQTNICYLIGCYNS